MTESEKQPIPRRLCGRPKANGKLCEHHVTAGAPACGFHLTPDERRTWNAAHPTTKKKRVAKMSRTPRRMTAAELQQAVNGGSQTTPTALPGEDAAIMLAAMRLYSKRVSTLTEDLAQKLGMR